MSSRESSSTGRNQETSLHGANLILVDAGAGTWFGGGAFGRLADSLTSAGYAPEQVDRVLVTHLHSDHIGDLTTRDGRRVFPNANVFVSKPENNFWHSPQIAAKAPKEVQPFFQAAQAISAPYLNAGKWHTFSNSEIITDGVQIVPLRGHTPGHTGYEFRQSAKSRATNACGRWFGIQREPSGSRRDVGSESCENVS